MNRSLLWKGLLIVAVVAVMGLSAWPPEEEIRLGLDLQGGMHLVLRVEVEDALRSDRDKVMDRVVQEARDEGVTGLQAEATGTTSFLVRGVPPEAESILAEITDDFFPEWDFQIEGEIARFHLKGQEEERMRDMAVRQALQTIRNRIDAFGVSEPVIQRQGLGGTRIVVQLPGVDDPERVKELIGRTAFLEFRIVDFPKGGGGVSSREEILSHYGGELPPDIEILEGDILDDQGRPVGTMYYAVGKTAPITGRDLKTARPGLGQFNDPIVEFMLTHEGGQRFGELTSANVGKGLAIVLDNRVVSAPNIRSRITDQGIIEGQFTQQEVEDLSMVLRTGALPAGLTTLEERTVGPSLGQDSIEQGLNAGLIGFVLVIVVMLVVYKLTGINAVVALTLNVVLVFGALAYFDATLTLPGIAGIILVVGMAVDANVLVFERIREELHAGRTVKSAVDNGFSKALSSIIDANVTTLLAAMFLFQFGTGPIRGFAVTLAIGILASLFTAVFVSRWIFDIQLNRPGRVERLSI
ncbi:MAG: protein translocase subunit SecD [Thermoanaerobaculia bacterium]|nr:protein translocase subunit SecD [Thermoanaerobaculia bacterium]